jgi:two-component system chemotaxis sensor kinase CheA
MSQRTNFESQAKSNVLVIDDSEIARSHISGILSDANYIVFEQPSAIGATRAIREHSVSAVVVDVSMPGLSGDKLVGVLRKNQRLDGLVVIVVTGKTQDELSGMCELSTADAVLFKDQLETSLVKTLSRLLRVSSYRPSATTNAQGVAVPAARAPSSGNR